MDSLESRTAREQLFSCDPNAGPTPTMHMAHRNADQLVYMLVCSKCGRTLGEWISAEEREKELRDFAKRVELLT